MLLLLSSFILFPFLTYYVSTHLFYRQVNSKALRKTPPTVPYLFTGIFHAFSLAYEGPQKYFATLLKDYGTSAPFAFKAGFQTFIVLRDPVHVEKVIQASKSAASDEIDLHKHEQIFGYPKSALHLYARKGSETSAKYSLRYAHVDVPKKHLTGTALANMADIYVASLSRSLNDKMFQFKFWTQIEDFWSFFQQVITRCTIEALFGTTILKEHRTFLKDYWAYDEAVAGFMPGLPRPFMTTAYEAPRDKMLHTIETWLKNHHSGSEFARIGEDDPAWDADKGSKFVQERDDVFAKLGGVDTRARAAEMLSILHGLNSSVVPSSFWSLVEVLGDDSVSKRLTSEIAQYHSPKSAEYDVAAMVRSPLMQAVQKETQRLHVASCFVRTLENDCLLDEAWSAPKGSSVVAFSHDISLNAQAWARASPRTVDKPLDQFWPERFAAFKQSQRKTEKTAAGRSGLEILEHALSVFEGDQNHVLGKDFVGALQTATLAVFLTEFEMQLCEVEVFEGEELPSPPQLAFGRLGFHQKMSVRIRKRAIKT